MVPLGGRTAPLLEKNMHNLNIAAPLAAALTARGYESLTPLQEAVLVDGTHGPDSLAVAYTTLTLPTHLHDMILGSVENVHKT